VQFKDKLEFEKFNFMVKLPKETYIIYVGNLVLFWLHADYIVEIRNAHRTVARKSVGKQSLGMQGRKLQGRH
jgi:hypothetical protein